MSRPTHVSVDNVLIQPYAMTKLSHLRQLGLLQKRPCVHLRQVHVDRHRMERPQVVLPNASAGQTQRDVLLRRTYAYTGNIDSIRNNGPSARASLSRYNGVMDSLSKDTGLAHRLTGKTVFGKTADQERKNEWSDMQGVPINILEHRGSAWASSTNSANGVCRS